MRNSLVALTLALAPLSLAYARGFPATPARLWAGGIAAAPRIPLLTDGDGDGRADLLAVFPAGEGIVDLARTSALGKPRFPGQARVGFGKDLILATAGRFRRPGGAGVLALGKDGGLALTDTLASDGRFVEQASFEKVAGRLPGKPVALVALPSGSGTDDALLVDVQGNALRVRFLAVGIEARKLSGKLPGVTQLCPTPGGDALFWTNGRGRLFRSAIADAGIGAAQKLLDGAPGEKLAVGRFTDAKSFDVLLGRQILPGGDPERIELCANLPDAKEQKSDARWLVGDLDGDGLDELVRVRRSGEKFSGDDVLIHAFGAANPLAETSGDGLLDAWKTGAVKPGGLDLAALGCRVGRKEVLVEMQRMADVTEEQVRREIGSAVGYYARLGLTLIPIYREPIPLADAAGRPWWEIGARYHPASHRGVTHWMLITNSGGGQSGELEDRGSCGSRALYATFLHEFGHQVGLDHTGRWAPNWCPIYPSLMNYAYSYQLGGKPDAVGYSDGRLSSLTLDERHLSETLPLPMDKIGFLAGPPYRYRMKPTPDGKQTLIDWNWNGAFGEKNVAADINYGYSTGGGFRNVIATAYAAPALGILGKSLAVVFGQLPEGVARPVNDGEAAKRSLGPDLPGRLTLRVWEGKSPETDGKKWSAGTEIATGGVTGDPSVASLGGALWVAYPTAGGVEIRAVDARKTVSLPTVVPGSAGAQPTLANWNGKLALLLWRDDKTPVGLRVLTAKSGTLALGDERALKLTAQTPLGAAPGERGALYLGFFGADKTGKQASAGQVAPLTLSPAGEPTLGASEWVGQRGSARPTLVFQPDAALKNRGGQLYFLAAGMFGAGSPSACHYVSTRIADRTVSDGWLTRRYYDEWTQSRSSPGACLLNGELIFASRWRGDAPGWRDNDLFVGFSGRGIETAPMGDFDDIGFIKSYGLAHSILYRSE